MKNILRTAMANSFGKSKQPQGRSAADIIQLYADNGSALNHHLEDIKNKALTELTMQWFEDNPLTLKNMAVWGQVMCPYLERTGDAIKTRETKPVAEYLNFVGSLEARQLIPNVVDTRSQRYDEFCHVIHRLVPISTVEVNPALVIIARDGSVDLHAFMAKMESMRKRQDRYAEYVLDDPREYHELPVGKVMHALLGLSFNNKWRMPQDDAMYHKAWSVLNEEDIELYGVEYGLQSDIIAHLVATLPTSTFEAWEYYEYHGSALMALQKQQILGMSLTTLDLPCDLEPLLNALYCSDMDPDEEGRKIFEAINPGGAGVLASMAALYDYSEDIIEHLGMNPHLQDALFVANAARKKENADAVVATFDF